MVFTGVDVGVAVLVLISAILATARGFTREILSLATWAGSAAIAAYMYFYHNDIAEKYIDNPLVATGVTVVGTFLVALIVLHLLTMWIGDMVVDCARRPARPHAGLRVRRGARRADLHRRRRVREFPAWRRSCRTWSPTRRAIRRCSAPATG